MSQYALIFRSKAALDWTSLAPSEAQKAAGAWRDWINSMGEAVRAAEAFKFGGKSVARAGAEAADNLLTGYVMVEAKSLDEAEELAAGAPNVASGEGSIEVYEILPTH